MEDELRIRIQKKLKNKLKARAKALNIPLSAYVRMLLSQKINDKKS